jgi:hypothetical protein
MILTRSAAPQAGLSPRIQNNQATDQQTALLARRFPSRRQAGQFSTYVYIHLETASALGNVVITELLRAIHGWFGFSGAA